MIDIIARGMIEESNGDISQISEKVNNHTEDSDIHVTATDKKNWNSHPNDVQASGNPVTLDGLQGGVPFSEMVVSGKNLIPFPYYETTKTVNGITFTDNGDGTIAVDGTASSDAVFYFANKKDIIPSGNSFYLSGCPVGGSGSTYDIVFVTFDENNTTISVYNDVGNGKRVTVSENAKTVNIYIRIRSGQTISNLIFRPQLEIGTTPTAYEPPITGRDLTVGVCGKNLLKYPYVNTTKTINGITFTDNGDGTITANGTATATVSFSLIWKNLHIPKGTYTISGCPKGGNVNTGFFIVCGTDSIRFATDTGNGGTFGVENDINDFTFSLRINSGVTVDNLVFRPQLEIGSTATPYEPYHGSTTTITPDSNPYTVPNDIRQQDGLNVVTASAGTLNVVGVRKNAAIKRIWDKMGMDLLFDGITSANNPAVVDLANYKFIEICHTMIANEKIYPANIRLSLDSYLSSASTITIPIVSSAINTIHTEEGTVSSLYAISAAGGNMNNTKIYGIK